MSLLIKLESICLEFDGKKILDNINLEINENEILAVIGLNGAGKTSLLKTMVGIYKPTSGNIIYNTNKFGYVPQKLDFDKTIPITVLEFLKIFSSASKNAIQEKLDIFGSVELLNKKIGNLSGGELQKILIINSLLQNSKIIFMDEPTSGIDLLGEKYFYDIINKIYSEFKISIVLVSHDIHTVFSKASRVVCLNKTICCSGKPLNLVNNDFIKNIYGNYLAPYTHNHDK